MSRVFTAAERQAKAIQESAHVISAARRMVADALHSAAPGADIDLNVVFLRAVAIALRQTAKESNEHYGDMYGGNRLKPHEIADAAGGVYRLIAGML